MNSSSLRLLGGVREHDRANIQYHAPARGNLVVMDSTSASYSSEEQDAFLGEWEKEVAVGYVKKVFKSTPSSEGECPEIVELDVVQCEPWAINNEGNIASASHIELRKMYSWLIIKILLY